MSTLRGRPLDPIDLSAYASHKARERSAAQQGRSEGDDLPVAASPYAPKRARGFSGTQSQALQIASSDPHQLQAVDLSAAAGDDGHPLPRFLVTGRSQEQPAPEWHPGHLGDSGPAAEDAPGTVPDSPGSTGEDGPDLLRPVGTGGATEHPMDLDAPSLQPVDAATGAAQEQSSANPGDEPFGDNDLERLEASLRWLQRAESTSRLPRAADLGPVQGVPPADARGRRYSAGLVARRTNLPRSLEPERMAPPPLKSGGDKWRLAVYTLIASILVAAISYYLAAGGWTSQPQPQPAAGPRVASVEPMITRQPSPAVVAQEGETVSARDDEREAPAQEEPTPGPAVTQPVEQPAGREKMAMLQPAETVAQPPPPAAPPTPSKALRTLDPEQIKLLLKQGEQFIAAGDLVTARMVLQRAAEAGDATAAIALGATYDPGVLARLGVVGMGAADVEKARSWYKKAESFGSSEATRRLQVLANR